MNYTIRPYQSGEEQYVADAHRRIYSEEYRWGESFTYYAAQIALTFPSRRQCREEELWVAESEGKLVGCIMLCRTEEAGVGQLRLFLVEKDYRNGGIGTALTSALMERARAVGYRRLILWSADPLHDALRHYEKLGFGYEEELENHDWSLEGKVVKELKMSLALT